MSRSEEKSEAKQKQEPRKRTKKRGRGTSRKRKTTAEKKKKPQELRDKKVHHLGTLWNLFAVLLAPLSNRTLDSEKHPRKTHGFQEKN